MFWCRAESKTILKVCKTLQRVKKIQVCIFSFFMPNSAQHVLFSIDYLLSTHRKIDSKPGLQSGSHFFKKQIVLHEPLSLRLERNACANDWLLAFEFRI